MTAYQQPARHYHTLQHLHDLFNHFDALNAHLEQPTAVGLAIFYHDAVYNPYRKDNEAQSADLARQHLLAAEVNETFISTVVNLILSTQQHVPQPFSNDGCYFLDMDLAILGASAEQYAQYAQAIRQEYRWVPWFLYRKERKKILQRLTERPHLYYTSTMQQRFDLSAHRNVAAELESLSRR